MFAVSWVACGSCRHEAVHWAACSPASLQGRAWVLGWAVPCGRVVRVDPRGRQRRTQTPEILEISCGGCQRQLVPPGAHSLLCFRGRVWVLEQAV